MSMTIGWASFTTDPMRGSLSVNGNTVSFAAYMGATSLNECKARIQQLSGLVDNPDEPVIPFTCTADSTLDGFYRVRSMQIDPLDRYTATGQCRFSTTLERVLPYYRPTFETVVRTVLRTNSHGVTTPAGVAANWYTTGSYPIESDASTYISFTGSTTLTTEDGSVIVGTVAAPLAVTSWTTYTRPADFYKGMARIEIQYGSTWYPIHGRQVPSGVGGNWRINNGYVRAYPAQSTAKYGLKVETYRSGSWYGTEFTRCNIVASAVSSYSDLTGGVGGYGEPTIVVNSPSMVTVSLWLATQYPIMFTLRQADTWVEVTIPTSAQSGMGPSSAIAGTAFTGGVRATANDANGLRNLLSTTNVTDTAAAAGAIKVSNATPTAVFQLTADYQVGIATTDTTVRDLFYSIRSERRGLVTR
jgi:hypothetical protein